jgi:hypothetical protein
MKVKDIDLKHFTIQLERVGSLINTTVIRIRSKPEHMDNYKDSHGEPIKLSFTLQTNMHLRFTEKTKKVILSFLPREEIYRLKDSIAYRLINIIKERDIQLYSTQNEILSNETSKNKENKDLDFSELDGIEKTQQIPILTDFAIKVEVTKPKAENNDLDKLDFDFDELDIVEKIAPKPTNDFDPSSDFDFEEPDVTPKITLETLSKDFDFADVLDTPATTKTIDDLLLKVRIYRGVLENSTKRTALLLAELKVHESTHERLKETVTKLERELFNELQKKYQ